MSLVLTSEEVAGVAAAVAVSVVNVPVSSFTDDDVLTAGSSASATNSMAGRSEVAQEARIGTDLAATAD